LHGAPNLASASKQLETEAMKPTGVIALPHYHPTLAEIWTYPAEKLAAQIS